MSTPSIALIPSGYKATKLYSQLPINGDGDLTFARTGTSGVPNATRVNEQGLIEDVNSDVPRLDYSDGGCPSLLLEPTSTNLVTESNIFDMAQSIADGTRTKITLNNGIEGIEQVLTSSGRDFKTQSITTVIGETYTVSFYVDEINIDIADGNPFISFISGESNAGIRFEDIVIGRNSYTYTATVTSASIRIGLGTSGNISASSLKMGGLQLELLPFASSLINTNGTIETRTQDQASKSGLSNYINSKKGVLYLDAQCVDDDINNHFYGVKSSTQNSHIYIYGGAGISDKWQCTVAVKGVNYYFSGITVKKNILSKIAVVWDEKEFTFYINGIKGSTQIVSNAFDVGELDAFGFSLSFKFYGKVNDARVYDTVLTDAELIDLTTI